MSGKRVAIKVKYFVIYMFKNVKTCSNTEADLTLPLPQPLQPFKKKKKNSLMHSYDNPLGIAIL